jgi:hypothetical protein
MFNWVLKLHNGHEIKFKSMLDAIKHAEHHDIKDCTIEGPALTDKDIFSAVCEVEAAGFEIHADCFLASFDGKVN